VVLASWIAVEDPPPAELPLLSALDALVPDVVLSLLVLFESVAALVLDVPPAEFVVPSLPEPDPSLEPQPRTDSAKANQLLWPIPKPPMLRLEFLTDGLIAPLGAQEYRPLGDPVPSRGKADQAERRIPCSASAHVA
jgi:hypothetical protein